MNRRTFIGTIAAVGAAAVLPKPEPHPCPPQLLDPIVVSAAVADETVIAVTDSTLIAPRDMFVVYTGGAPMAELMRVTAVSPGRIKVVRGIGGTESVNIKAGTPLRSIGTAQVVS